ncbi:MAG: hypothetical protein J5871_04470, partial [Bacteroidales bacterium]|nr:hypothetical protein [Bacteroidales bacterium]
VYYESGGAGIRACYATGITVQSTSDITGECGGIAGLYYSPTNTSGDVTNVIYHCQAKNCTIQATTARGSSGWATSRLGGIVGELDNSSRIIQCASKQNKVYGRTGCGGIAGMVQTKVSLGEGHVLIRGCLSQSNWLYGTVTNEDNDLGGIVGLITQEANSDEKKRYVRISECISNANCYEAKSSSDNWEATSGGIAGKISGDGANVAIRNSFSDHHATVSGNPKGAGVRCFYLSRTKANGKAAAGGFVGYFSSGTTGILRIYNSGSHITYGAWYMGGNVSTAEYLNYDQYTNTSGYDWRTLGINPMIGRVYRGQVNLNVVFWSTLAAPFTYNQWHSSSSIKDVRADDSTDTFEYKSDGAEYLTSTCINNDFTVKVVYHYADGTTKTYNFAHTYYWKPFSTDGHAPTRVKWGTANYQAVTMLNGTTGYARDNTVVNEGMGYDGHNWIHTDGRLVNNNRWYPAIGWYGN